MKNQTWVAAHARLNEFTDDGKYHNLMTWLICLNNTAQASFRPLKGYLILMITLKWLSDPKGPEV